VLVLAVTAFSIARYVYHWPVALERVMIFPLAVVPNLWGLWNMLFVATHSRTHLSIGIHGALLPFLLGPLGILLTLALDFQIPGFATHIFPILAPLALIVYYLVWKYVVHFLNAVLGIA
ncbi:MAG: hypothetical protein ACRD3S_15130, partial [Terracidiphilus sp.]